VIATKETGNKKEKAKKEKNGKEIVAEDAVKETSAPAPAKESKKKSAAAESVSSGEKSVKDRLKELDDLKKDEMITDKEYQAKRKELLKQL
jgi:hypothetical protein